MVLAHVGEVAIHRGGGGVDDALGEDRNHSHGPAYHVRIVGGVTAEFHIRLWHFCASTLTTPCSGHRFSPPIGPDRTTAVNLRRAVCVL
jgi:hypothetical protein